MSSNEYETQPFENPAETMRKVMGDLGKIETLNDPAGDHDEPWVVAIPKSKDVRDLTPFLREAATVHSPIRRNGTANFFDLDSLIAWANRFKNDNSVLYARPDRNTPTLMCIANYHEGGPETFEGLLSKQAAYGDHRGSYAFPLSKEWKAWSKISGVILDKDEMGEFIEANAKDIQDPTPAILKMDVGAEGVQKWEERLINTARQIEGRFGQLHQLLAMSRQFAVKETSDLTVSSNRDTGEQTIQFVNEHKDADGAPIRIPNLIIVTIPVFEGGASYRMPVRFRYRKSGSKIGFILTLYNPENAFDDAFSGAVEAAKEATGLPVFIGTPE